MATLYHYTTGAGLIGMLKDYSAENPNLMMWATHYMLSLIHIWFPMHLQLPAPRCYVISRSIWRTTKVRHCKQQMQNQTPLYLLGHTQLEYMPSVPMKHEVL